MEGIIRFNNDGKEYCLEDIVRYYGLFVYVVLRWYYTKQEAIELCAKMFDDRASSHEDVLTFKDEKDFSFLLMDNLFQQLPDHKQLKGKKAQRALQGAKGSLKTLRDLFISGNIQGKGKGDFYGEYQRLKSFYTSEEKLEGLDMDEKALLSIFLMACKNKKRKGFETIGNKIYETIKLSAKSTLVL